MRTLDQIKNPTTTFNFISEKDVIKVWVVGYEGEVDISSELNIDLPEPIIDYIEIKEEGTLNCQLFEIEGEIAKEGYSYTIDTEAFNLPKDTLFNLYKESGVFLITLTPKYTKELLSKEIPHFCKTNLESYELDQFEEVSRLLENYDYILESKSLLDKEFTLYRIDFGALVLAYTEMQFEEAEIELGKLQTGWYA